MYYCKEIDKKEVLLHEYFQSAIRHAPHFRRVVKEMSPAVKMCTSRKFQRWKKASWIVKE